jgi:hypothetical protein
VTATLTIGEDVAALASRLVGWHVELAEPVRRGGNNRVFRLSGSGRRAALKFYPAQADDPRDRLAQEYTALLFLHRHGFDQVPQPIARDVTAHCAAYAWIDGTSPQRADEHDVDALADFFLQLQTARDRKGAQSLVAASAACFSPAMVAEQVHARLARLRSVVASGTEVAEFVASRLAPAAEAATEHLRVTCTKTGPAYAEPLAQHLRVLSPSDFGLHNALRRPDGRLAFVDFEYFGWDDPAKAIADVMLHAGMALTDALSQRFRTRVEAVLSAADGGLSFRLNLLFPSMVLLWCLILLNEFLPERWTRRAIAGDRDDREAVQAAQLHRARELLARNFA